MNKIQIVKKLGAAYKVDPTEGMTFKEIVEALEMKLEEESHYGRKQDEAHYSLNSLHGNHIWGGTESRLLNFLERECYLDLLDNETIWVSPLNADGTVANEWSELDKSCLEEDELQLVLAALDSSTDSLHKQLLTRCPALEKAFIKHVNNTWELAIRQLGSKLSNVYNTGFARDFSGSGTMHKLWGKMLINGQPNGEAYLFETAVKARAKSFAKETVFAWKGKIDEKLGELEDAKIIGLDNTDFEITGIRNGHDVRIVQRLIEKISCRGLFHYQFPSRIYVDGKFIPAKKYKEMWGEK